MIQLPLTQLQRLKCELKMLESTMYAHMPFEEHMKLIKQRRALLERIQNEKNYQATKQ
jgi:uncharacterized protein (DUF2267 family)